MADFGHAYALGTRPTVCSVTPSVAVTVVVVVVRHKLKFLSEKYLTSIEHLLSVAISRNGTPVKQKKENFGL